MNRRISLSLCMVLMFLLTGCGNSGSSSGNPGNRSVSVNDVLEAEISNAGQQETDSKNRIVTEQSSEPTAETKRAEQAEPAAQTERETAGPAVGTKTDLPGESKTGETSVDLDLTTMSGTMVYSEVLYLMSAPEEYIGKKVKMDGTCACYYDEDADVYYYACLIKDATACCSQGIEFVLTDDYSCPEEYPEIGEDICVVGEFSTYEEGGNRLCTLINASLEMT